MRSTILLVAGALVVVPAAGHHSDAAIDINSVVTVEGTVTEYSWRNPHVYFTVETDGEDGERVEWTVQMAGSITVSRMGWTAESLSVGERVAVRLHPARDGRTYGLFDSIDKEGVALPTSFDSETGELTFVAPEVTGSTTTLEGRWILDRSSLGPDDAGSLDQLTRRALTLTEKGRTAQAAYSENSEDNPELACMSKPTPGAIIYSSVFPLEFEFDEAEEIIIIRSQFFDQVRTVYMDGREHPPADQRTHEGHSIGWWEGDVLLVDTRNFADNRSPYQNGIPSGARKHVLERYRLHEDGARLTVEFMLEDPEYIVGSMTHSRDLIYAPQLEMTPFDCDMEATRRLMPSSG